LNIKNRTEQRAQRASKHDHYSLSVDVAAAAVVTATEAATDAAFNIYGTVKHSLASPIAPHADQSACIDVIQVSDYTPTAKLEDLGFSSRFFGVAKFFKHDQASAEIPATRDDTTLLFARDVDVGKNKRSPRRMHVFVDNTSSVNLIPSKALSQLSPCGKLKIVESRTPSKTDPRSVVQLAFQICSNRRTSPSDATVTGWFVVDGSIASDTVILSKSFANEHNICGQTMPPSRPGSPDSNNALIGRVFFDTGAQMSCISKSLLVPGLCYNRAVVNTVIMQ
jgi:hypothetical protein